MMLLSLLVSPSLAADQPLPIDEETKKVCNQVILSIYKDILAVKDKYNDLKDFGEKSFYQNKYGIYTILYEFQSEEQSQTRRKKSYRFAITIDGMEDKIFAAEDGVFNLGFPLLGVKFSGYQQRHLLRSQLDIMPFIEKHGAILADYQQKFLPLQIYLRKVRGTYKAKEDIEFEVVLKNVTKRHMIVKGLGHETLFFLFDGQTWGTQPAAGNKGGEKKILRAGESLNMIFKGESFPTAKEIEIFAMYRMSIQGVNPTSRLKIQIVE
ncbi:MAG: hypothetical protein NUV91_02940 [Candidatus Omnitrophica bacterium]|nr:hypothetical protein [Candidatus Omnitrophota bacterium]